MATETRKTVTSRGVSKAAFAVRRRQKEYDDVGDDFFGMAANRQD